MLTVKGIYKDGHAELIEMPALPRARLYLR
jgi:hypothetical protein